MRESDGAESARKGIELVGGLCARYRIDRTELACKLGEAGRRVAQSIDAGVT